MAAWRVVVNVPYEPPHKCQIPAILEFGIGSVIQCECDRYYKLCYSTVAVEKRAWFYIHSYQENDA